MKLFSKAIDNKLFKQYSFGSDLSKQKVVAKIFNPYGNGTWYILNSDPNDPDYLWAIVDLGYGAEVGSVSRSDLENYRNRMRLGFERDKYFDEINAKELYEGLLKGESYNNGGDISNGIYEVKHSKENNTYQVWKSDFLVTDFVTKKEADAVAKRLNSLYSYDNGGEVNELEIGQKYRAKNGDILTIKDFDIEDHVTTDDGKGKMSSMGIQRISIFKELIKDGELVHLSEDGSKMSSREEFMNKEIQTQKEKEKNEKFKLFKVNVYEQNKNKEAYPFVEPHFTDNFVEALNFAKETIKKQRNYRSNSGVLWATIDSFTPIEKRQNVRYPYSELIRFDEEKINSSKYDDGGQLEMEYDGVAYAKTKGKESVDWDKELRDYAGSEYSKLSAREKENIISDMQRDWDRSNSFDNGGSLTPENNKFNYMMLSRLQQDCDYYLGYGNRSEKSLWAGNVDDHIKEMKKLWNNLPKDKKPEWLTMEDILDYEKKMKSDSYSTGGRIETKIQKKVDEVNALIEKAIDSDGDPLMVVDTTITWEEPMQYKPIVYKNGRLYIEYFEPYSGKTEKDVINKSNVDFDGYPTLLNIAKMYRKALKKEGISYSGGGKTTFKEKATAIAKNFEGKKVEPKYQKEYGKVYDKAEAKEVGNKIAGSQKAKYDSKMSKGGSTTKRGGAMVLAKEIRKDGESWRDALKRANQQLKK